MSLYLHDSPFTSDDTEECSTIAVKAKTTVLECSVQPSVLDYYNLPEAEEVASVPIHGVGGDK